MAEISFSGKAGAVSKTNPEPEAMVVEPDKSWLQPYCRKCPYFVNENEHLKMLLCVRPFGEKCLAENILVAGMIVADAHNDHMRKQYRENNGPTAIAPITNKLTNKLTKKRRSKMIKRGR